MFKSARWRSEKNKIKAVFKLQFHATQVSNLAVDALMISVVPAHVGKPTVRLGKANVRDGNCYWENPVYETVKFVREPKTGKIHERIYHFVVGTASSKTGIVGEVSIDFANYAEATKISSLSLPLKNAKSEAVLHVSLQRIHDSNDQRDVEETETELSSLDGNLEAQISTDGSIKSNLTEDLSFHKIISHVPELNGNHRATSGSDVAISSSGSSSTFDTPTELRKMTASIQDANGFLSLLSNVSETQTATTDASKSIFKEHHRSEWQWLEDSVPEASTDDSLRSLQGTLLTGSSQEDSEVVIEKLRIELAVLARQVEVSELELQTLRKQIVKEIKRGQDLSRELLSLQEERDGLKDKCKKVEALQECMDTVKPENRSQFKGGDPWALVEELRVELNFEKDNSANLKIQLQKTKESNSELMLALRDLDEMLEQKNREILNLSKQSAMSENAKELHVTNSKCEIDDDEEQRALEELVKQHSNAKEADMLEQKIMDLYGEIEICKRDKDELEAQMEQLALDYEILKQENHDISYKLEQCQLQEQLKMQYECSYSYTTVNELEEQIESLENELMKRSKEFSNLLITINEFETHVKNLEEELENQARGFESDLEALMHAKVEQEQKAIRAEETLRKTQLSNLKTAERLQEELNRLSMQMASTFDANEKLATKAQCESKELHRQKSQLEEMLQKAKKELLSVREHYEEKLHQLSSQITSKMNLTEHMQPETGNKFMKLEYQKKHNEEDHKLLSEEILMLKNEIKMLTSEKNILSKQGEENATLRAELQEMNKSLDEMRQLVEKGNTGGLGLDDTLALMKKEDDNSMKELNILRCLEHEQELIVGTLQSEVETPKVHANEFKHSLFENELEKEKIVQLKQNLKEDALSGTERKLKDSSNQTLISEGPRVASKNYSSLCVACGSKEAVNLKEKTKLLEGQIRQKENALQTSTNSFLEKEKDLQSKFDELEQRLEESQKSVNFCAYEPQKACEGTRDFTMNGRKNGEMWNTTENSRTMPFMCNESDSTVSLVIKSNNDNFAAEELNVALLNTKGERDLDYLLNEMTALKERNKLMEGELKEMQERYSEISLKFAEVEGERQQLLMTLRNHTNSKRASNLSPDKFTLVNQPVHLC